MVWKSLATKGLSQLGGHLSLEDWIMSNLCNKTEDSYWPTKFLVTLWYIWKWRNGVCFEGKRIHVQDRVEFLLGKYKEHLTAIAVQREPKHLNCNIR